MALLDSEIRRIKYELGYNVLTVGAEPYIGVHAIFDQVIATYMSSGASTTSTTAVTAATTPTPIALTLASATDFTVGDRVVVDVDERQETATIQSLSGSTITVLLSLTHAGTYPVTVEGGESIVRELLGRIRSVAGEMADTFGEGALKKVDEIEFYQAGNKTLFGTLGDQLSYWRDELASCLGVQNLRKVRRGGGQMLALM